MDGLLLFPGRRGYAAPPTFPTAFSYLFSPLADAMRPLHWFADRYESSPFNGMVGEPGNEGWYERAVVNLPAQERDGFNQSGLLFRPGTLPDAARHLRSDWMDLIGFQGGDEHAVRVAERLYRSTIGDDNEYHRLIGEHADLYFHCMDGWSWEVYAASEDRLWRVVEHLSGNPAITVEQTTLSKKAERP